MKTNKEGESSGNYSNESKKEKKPVIRGFLGLTILKLLKEKEMFGAEIEREIKTRFDLTLPPGLIYVILKKLEEKGLVQSKWQTENQPPRKIYSITEKGKKFLICATKKLRRLEKVIRFLLQD